MSSPVNKSLTFDVPLNWYLKLNLPVKSNLFIPAYVPSAFNPTYLTALLESLSYECCNSNPALISLNEFNFLASKYNLCVDTTLAP